MYQLIHSAIKKKLNFYDSFGHSNNIRNIVESELEKHCGKFKISQLTNYDLANPYDTDLLLFWVMYKYAESENSKIEFIQQLEKYIDEHKTNLQYDDISSIINTYKYKEVD